MGGKLFYIAKFLRGVRFPLLPKIIEMILRYFFACEISSNMTCGKGLRLVHGGLGVVIHPKAQIGNNVTILQNVTIGGVDGDIRLPIIEDNVLIGCGAAVLGGVRLGKGCKIGANAVVLCDVPSEATAVGVPARLILKK